MIKSDKMGAIPSELDSSSEYGWYQHEDEEMHLFPQDKMEYAVGEKSYKMDEGGIPWHLSTLKRTAKI